LGFTTFSRSDERKVNPYLDPRRKLPNEPKMGRVVVRLGDDGSAAEYSGGERDEERDLVGS
jgi:hypothetical protein